MSIANSQARRTLARDQQQRVEGKMAKSKPQINIEMERVDFSEKQLRHVNKLRGAIDTANAALQNFLVYLGEEHEVTLDGSWVLGEKGFERPVPPVPPENNEGGQGDVTPPA